MAKDANLYIRINQETKDKAEKIFSTFGITISDAVNIFLNKSILVGGLPFEMLISVPERIAKTAFQLAQKKAVYEFISGLNAIDDSLTDDDYTEFESGKYKLQFDSKEFIL